MCALNRRALAQKQIIYQSVSKTQKNNAVPTGFRPTIGAPVPEGIVVGSVPATIVELIPQTKGLEAALVEGSRDRTGSLAHVVEGRSQRSMG